MVDPEGRLCSLEITEISGIAGMAEVDQVEEFQTLDLSPVGVRSLCQRGN